MSEHCMVDGALQDSSNLDRVLSEVITCKNGFLEIAHGFVFENLTQQFSSRIKNGSSFPPEATGSGSSNLELSYTDHESANG